MATRTPLDIPAGRLSTLRRWNVVAGALHAASAVAVLALANDFTIPVTASYIEGPPGTTDYTQVTLWETPMAWGVAAFFVLSALAHAWVASPPGFARYAAERRRGSPATRPTLRCSATTRAGWSTRCRRR